MPAGGGPGAGVRLGTVGPNERALESDAGDAHRTPVQTESTAANNNT